MTVKETQNTLVFEVDLKATKTEVKQAVESLFKVKVTGVRTTTVKGRSAAGASSPATAPTGRRLTFASKTARKCRSISIASKRDLFAATEFRNRSAAEQSAAQARE